MRSILRGAAVAAMLVGITTQTAQAEISLREVRLDIANLTYIDGSTVLDLGGPSSLGSAFLAGVASPKLALAFYFNENVAIEPQLGVVRISPDGGDSLTVITVGAAVPYYFGGGYGKSGLFVSPSAQITKVTDVDTLADFGAEIGYKKSINDNLSWRVAGGFRTGDSTDDEVAIGASFGFSFFWK